MAATQEIEWTLAPGQSGRLDAITRMQTGLSNSNARGLIQQGGVRVDGVVCTNIAQAVAEGTRIQVRYQPGRRYHEKSQVRASRHWRLVYEDAHLLVVDKAA